MDCHYVPLAHEPPGTLAKLLRASYASWITQGLCDADEIAGWIAYDQEAFAQPDTVGACLFFTRRGGQLVGFASWDPRQAPEVGIVGHNCILPAFRGQGLGSGQLREVLRRFSERKIHVARVSTLDHPFFVPAQRMYLACGFRDVERSPWPRNPAIGQIVYERPVTATHARSDLATAG